jgi:hypothetical protein
MEHEVAGDRHSALDHYKQARAAAADSAAKSKAEDGVAACQGYFARCADAAKYTHPESGKTKKYDSRAKALDAAVMRTRAGERVTVRGCDVMPTKNERDFYCSECGSTKHLNLAGVCAACAAKKRGLPTPVKVGGRDGAVSKGDKVYVQGGKWMGKYGVVLPRSIASEKQYPDMSSVKLDRMPQPFRISNSDLRLASEVADSLSPVRVGGRDDATGNAMNDGHLAEIKKAWNSKIYAHYRTIYNAEGKAAADKYLQQFTTRKITDTTLSPVRVGGRDDLMSRREEENLHKALRKNKGGIEAYGVKGFKNTSWRKVFKSREALEKWCKENDAEVQGTRDVE